MGRRRHRWPKRKPSAKGQQVVGWVIVTLGMGDPLPSVVERIIRRTGASIASSGWSWTCRADRSRRGWLRPRRRGCAAPHRGGRVRQGISIGNPPDTMWYTCRYYDTGTKRCTDYENRPNLCRIYACGLESSGGYGCGYSPHQEVSMGASYTVENVEITRIAVQPTKGDPVHVDLDDTNGRGQVTIRCYDRVWSYNWPVPNRGKGTLLAFLAGVDESYAANKLDADGWFDTDATRASARRMVLEARRRNELDADDARELYDSAQDIHGETHAAQWGQDLASVVDGFAGDYMPHTMIVDPTFAHVYREAWPVLKHLRDQEAARG